MVLAVLLGAAPARADGFVDVAGGVAIPVENYWWRLNNPSPKLGVRLGATMHANPVWSIGILASGDWTYVRSFPGEFGFDFAADRFDRFRVLSSLIVLHPVAAKVAVGIRIGAGADVAHASHAFRFGGTTQSRSDTDAGFAFEAAAGAWYDIGARAHVGGELGAPIGHHAEQPPPSSKVAWFDYTSVDIDLLIALRVRF